VRVLHLAPPSPVPPAITAHTFIDEEIAALQEAGVECLTISDTTGADRVCNGVRILAVPSPAPSASIRRTLAMTLRQTPSLPFSRHTLGDARIVFHALRIERAAADAIREHDIDVVHSHFGWPEGFGGQLAAAETDAPLVTSLRGMDLLHRRDLSYGLRLNPTYDAAIRRLAARAGCTIYATEFMRRQGIAAGAPPERTLVLRKGVDLGRFRPPDDRAATRRQLGHAGPMILAVGTLRPLKGYPVLFEALAKIREHPWSVVICGEGPERQTLEELAATLHLADRVTFAGRVDRDRIAAHFAAADIFVHASHIEAAGNVVLEALASACAVVVSDCGGPREHVVDGRTGFIVPANDPGALAARLRELLTDPPLRALLGAAARADVERRFPYRRMVAGLIDVYRGISAGRRVA
jgi:glycosyltransferase involved in cell wall biosynthesis